MYNNPYVMNYNQQPNIDRIDAQINELKKLKEQMQKPIQPTNLTQNFQLAPTRENMKYANSIDDVQKDVITGDTPYFSRDLSILWIKNTKGEIKTFELNEIVPRDEKDILISSLQMQIEELRKEMKENAKPNNANDAESITDEKSSNVSSSRTSTKKSK